MPSAARYQSRLGETGRGGCSVIHDRFARVVSYYHPFHQTLSVCMVARYIHLLVSQILLNGLFFSWVVAGLKVIHLYRSYVGSGSQARCEMELVCSSQARQVPKKCVFFTQKDLPAPQENEVLHEKMTKKVPKRASSPAKTEFLPEKNCIFLLKNTSQPRKKLKFCKKK